MEFIYGKLNNEIELAEYHGLSTSTADVDIDQTNHTISVNVKNSPSSISDALLFTKQYLNSAQINQVYSNLNLLDYLNKNIILIDKVSQNVTGDFRVNGLLSTNNSFIELNNSGNILNSNAGLKIKNWSKGKDAQLYINQSGSLKYNNGIVDQYVLTRTNMDYNKFTYFNGQNLSTRAIKPTDIDTKSYTPATNTDLTTRLYVDNAVIRNGNYRIVDTVEDYVAGTTWAGLRVFIKEDAVING